MSDHPAEPVDLHPTEALVPLVEGELPLEELRAVVRHVRGCPRCQSDLVEVAAGAGALRGMAREGLDEIADPPPLAVHPLEAAPPRPVIVPDPVAAPPAPRRGSRPVLRAVGVAAAAVLLVLGGVVVGTRVEGTGGSDDVATPSTTSTTEAGTAPETVPQPYATAQLVAVGAAQASGSIAMSEEPGGSPADDQLMEVSTADLGPAPSGHFYEVWLFQPETNQMVAVGVLPDSGTATFALPAGLVANYQAVDISLQPDDGSIAHSGDSVLRATYG